MAQESSVAGAPAPKPAPGNAGDGAGRPPEVPASPTPANSSAEVKSAGLRPEADVAPEKTTESPETKDEGLTDVEKAAMASSGVARRPLVKRQKKY